jgi:hypothetical protein
MREVRKYELFQNKLFSNNIFVFYVDYFSVYVHVCISICLSVCLSINYLFMYLHVCMYICLSVRIYVYGCRHRVPIVQTQTLTYLPAVPWIQLSGTISLYVHLVMPMNKQENVIRTYIKT